MQRKCAKVVRVKLHMEHRDYFEYSSKSLMSVWVKRLRHAAGGRWVWWKLKLFYQQRLFFFFSLFLTWSEISLLYFLCFKFRPNFQRLHHFLFSLFLTTRRRTNSTNSSLSLLCFHHLNVVEIGFMSSSSSFRRLCKPQTPCFSLPGCRVFCTTAASSQTRFLKAAWRLRDFCSSWD